MEYEEIYKKVASILHKELTPTELEEFANRSDGDYLFHRKFIEAILDVGPIPGWSKE